MASTNEIIAARHDQDLRARLDAAAQAQGLPAGWVDQRLGHLVAVPVTASEDGVNRSIADVYAYAVATYVPAPRPGENLAAVTDGHITAAISIVQGTP